MRILPVNNYNYQSKTQNNKQNVNFGLFQGDAADAKKLCDLAGFTKLGERLNTFLKFLVGRQFKKKELKELQALVDKAEKANVVMSPKEHRSVEIILSAASKGPKTRWWMTYDSGISNTDFITLFDAVITGAKPVTGPIQARLSKLEAHVQEIKDIDANLAKPTITVENAPPLIARKARRLSNIDQIKQELHAASAAK